MVWHCLECDKDFNRKAGEHHRIHSEHEVQRQLKGNVKPTEHQFFSQDDVDPQRLDVEKSDTISNTRKTITKHEKQLQDNSELQKGILLFLQEEREWQDKMLKWIRQKKAEFDICERFGYGLCQRKN
jgi:hypothetical protein